MRPRCPCLQMSGLFTACPMVMVIIWASLSSLSLWPGLAQAMRESQVRELRKETEYMFYHGFDNYMKHAFPEDELRPLSCRPLMRDRDDPTLIELNDVLGNYSLTLIDSLSTLAILASSDTGSGPRAWKYFQNGVRDLVRLYGDGSDGPTGQGERGRGFDLDSKVQVFETVIRGLGGLLSAHLFAVGELPIQDYSPLEEAVSFAKAWDKRSFPARIQGIRWSNGFVYDGQLLRLARDLGDRLLPAFYTETGLPYPRVNLRHGVPFYPKSPINPDMQHGDSETKFIATGPQSTSEVTETCSAGAGSLVLEFTVLSRLTGDGRYEELAKRAFWAVWTRRSDLGLIGAGIDAESGRWATPYTGIGAGIDSFFEYAFKSYILLSSGDRPDFDSQSQWRALDDYYIPLSESDHSAGAFLQVWRDSRAAIKRHVYRGSGYQHPHFVQGDIFTGAVRALWIDSLSAYYPGLLTLAGEIDGAIETHLLTAALWTRFSALPERWNVATGNVDNGLGWWAGRPEFIESTYYLYRATKDPWYLHVGEMVLRDIKRRCWTKCGWAGLQDVQNGELSDRMESFFLGETVKYLFLLYDPSHPLNNLDAPFVFSTEGHPLIIPRDMNPTSDYLGLDQPEGVSVNDDVCQIPPRLLPLGLSSIAARPDVFHAASLARLHLMPCHDETEGAILPYASDHPSVTLADLHSPSNYTFYPWTLPPGLVPFNATSSPMSNRPTLDLSFPNFLGTAFGPGALERVQDGFLIRSIPGIRLGMIQDAPLEDWQAASPGLEGFRIQVINDVPLGKDEKVYLSRQITFDIIHPADPNFTRTRDPIILDLIVDVDPERFGRRNATGAASSHPPAKSRDPIHPRPSASDKLGSTYSHVSSMRTALSSLMNHVSSILRDDSLPSTSGLSGPETRTVRLSLPAVTFGGLGSAPLPDVEEASVFTFTGKPSLHQLLWSSIYFSDEICDHKLPPHVVRDHQILVIKRGGCTFSEKLRNIPAFIPSSSALQLVVIVSYNEPKPSTSSSARSERRRQHSFLSTLSQASPLYPKAALLAEPYLSRPQLEEPQFAAGGILRPRPISAVMVGGGDETYALLRSAVGVGIKWRYTILSQGLPIVNLHIL